MTDAPQDDRLAALDETIERARDSAEDAKIIDDPDTPRFVDSGDTEADDDQTIAPPG